MNADVTVVETTEVITERERSKVNAYKIEVLQDLLSILAEEDVDAVLLAVLGVFKEKGYKLQAEPEVLLKTINERFSCAS